ncbi:hypothetical protein LOTGIDRAFT_239315 [Lottia gigantea]|uniref:Uncharacterized protein n=1 Tax=Lottia gigantea TaxID=225164 RepID=V4C4A9_LOTGI|nr:hypothetical protein LOTGIDRAFT_239315 [Lottia gigantea]ESO96364.1 hypothetical protein LOTGIDRAFT_239315 [Lottia gigantea]
MNECRKDCTDEDSSSVCYSSTSDCDSEPDVPGQSHDKIFSVQQTSGYNEGQLKLTFSMKESKGDDVEQESNILFTSPQTTVNPPVIVSALPVLNPEVHVPVRNEVTIPPMDQNSLKGKTQSRNVFDSSANWLCPTSSGSSQDTRLPSTSSSKPYQLASYKQTKHRDNSNAKSGSESDREYSGDCATDTESTSTKISDIFLAPGSNRSYFSTDEDVDDRSRLSKHRRHLDGAEQLLKLDSMPNVSPDSGIQSIGGSPSGNDSPESVSHGDTGINVIHETQIECRTDININKTVSNYVQEVRKVSLASESDLSMKYSEPVQTMSPIKSTTTVTTSCNVEDKKVTSSSKSCEKRHSEKCQGDVSRPSVGRPPKRKKFEYLSKYKKSTLYSNVDSSTSLINVQTDINRNMFPEPSPLRNDVFDGPSTSTGPLNNDSVSNSPVKKRGPGRPKGSRNKFPSKKKIHSVLKVKGSQKTKVKGKPGRKKKIFGNNLQAGNMLGQNGEIKIKRGPGRPRKNPLPPPTLGSPNQQDKRLASDSEFSSLIQSVTNNIQKQFDTRREFSFGTSAKNLHNFKSQSSPSKSPSKPTSKVRKPKLHVMMRHKKRKRKKKFAKQSMGGFGGFPAKNTNSSFAKIKPARMAKPLSLSSSFLSFTTPASSSSSTIKPALFDSMKFRAPVSDTIVEPSPTNVFSFAYQNQDCESKKKRNKKLLYFRSKHKNIIDPVLNANYYEMMNSMEKLAISEKPEENYIRVRPGEVLLPSIFRLTKINVKKKKKEKVVVEKPKKTKIPKELYEPLLMKEKGKPGRKKSTSISEEIPTVLEDHTHDIQAAIHQQCLPPKKRHKMTMYTNSSPPLPSTKDSSPGTGVTPTPEKRKVGRPRKYPLPTPKPKESPSTNTTGGPESAKTKILSTK